MAREYLESPFTPQISSELSIHILSWPDFRKEFIEICRRAFRLNMQASTESNISTKLGGDTFLVKPSGLSLSDSRIQDLL